MIATPVQCDVDGIPKGSHYVRVPIALGRPNVQVQGRAADRRSVPCNDMLGLHPDNGENHLSSRRYPHVHHMALDIGRNVTPLWKFAAFGDRFAPISDRTWAVLSTCHVVADSGNLLKDS